MKKTLPIYLLMICFLFLSCEIESTDFTEIEKTDLTMPIIETENGIDGRGPDCTSEESMLERQLHWFSFIAAAVLAESNSARQEIDLYLSVTSNDNINAEDLIGSQALSGFSSFSAEFYDMLLAHLDPQWPTNGGNHPVTPTDTGGYPLGTPAEAIANAFYNNILKYNCIELYFPNGVDFSTGFDLTSSTHPLTQADCNEGYLYKYRQVVQSFIISGIELDQNYPSTNDNVLIARPFRLLTPECTYSEYTGIDFEDFMD